MEERRLSPRRPAWNAFRFSCMSCGTRNEYLGRTNDVSSVGMKIETDHQLKKGELIRIKTDGLPDKDKFASIAWTARSRTGFQAGVKFEGKEAVKDFVWYEEFK